MYRAAAIVLLASLTLLACKGRQPAVTPTRAEPVATAAVSGRPCGDRAVLARLRECKDSRTVKRCLRNGGNWETTGLAKRKACVCPTGQKGCPCRTSSDCAHACTAPLGKGANRCEGLTRGTCAGQAPLPGGCRCTLEPDGTARAICED